MSEQPDTTRTATKPRVRRVDHSARQCEMCRHSFVPKRADARFCCPACRLRHHRAAKVAGIAENGKDSGFDVTSDLQPATVAGLNPETAVASEQPQPMPAHKKAEPVRVFVNPDAVEQPLPVPEPEPVPAVTAPAPVSTPALSRVARWLLHTLERNGPTRRENVYAVAVAAGGWSRGELNQARADSGIQEFDQGGQTWWRIASNEG